MIELIDNSTLDEPYQAIATRALRLVFHWVHDRWAHAIIVGERARGRVVARSLDDTDAGVDPREIAAPIFQDVHLQRDGDTALALLVGQADRHHFSATFRVVESPKAVWIEVDIADRQTRPLPQPRPVAYTYLVEAPIDAIDESSHKLVRWSFDAPAGGLVLGAADSLPTSTIVVAAEAGPRACIAQPIARFDLEAPAQRCRFAWTWEPTPSDQPEAEAHA